MYSLYFLSKECLRRRTSSCFSVFLSSMLFLLLRTVLIITVLSNLLPSHAAPLIESDTQAMIYLSQFGYLPPSVRNRGTIMTEDTVKNAIAEFQAFAGLNVTGEMDRDTIETMSLPRCGVKDKVGYGTDSRSKRYALQGSRWKVKDLTYKIAKYPSTKKLDKQAVDVEIANAFGVWSQYTDLKFTNKKSGQVHIEIRFEKGEHGDGDPFDGRGGTLAHAYFPVYGGDAHFDDAEDWTIKSYRGTNLFQVAAHEFGHSLGLSHSDVKSALMAPFYRGYDPNFRLDQDDVDGIQALYGKKSRSGPDGASKPSTTEKTTNNEATPGQEDLILCKDGSVDTMFNSAEGTTYVFKGDHYWKLTADGVANGYPRLISTSWRGLPGSIDAAFTYRNGKTYFFKGDQYWRFIGKKMDGEYPKPISEGFTGIPDNLDAALVWGGNGKIYFYKGSKFWRFDPSQRPPVKSTYPKPISNWEGIPDNLDAALQYTNGYTYFFKNNAYWRFNDRTFSVDAADPAFPRSAGHWWFGCASQTSGTYRPGNFFTNWFSSQAQDEDGGFTSPSLHTEHSDSGLQSRHSDVDDIILDAGEDQSLQTPVDEKATSSTTHLDTTCLALLIVSVVFLKFWST